MDSQLLKILNRIDNLKQQGRIHPSNEIIYQDLLKYIQNQTALSDAQHQAVIDATNKSIDELKAFNKTISDKNDEKIKEQVNNIVSSINISNTNKDIIRKLLEEEIKIISSTSPYNYATEHLRIKSVFNKIISLL
jgi:DNA-binding transcriptional regulator GbsR (MarR family)